MDGWTLKTHRLMIRDRDGIVREGEIQLWHAPDDPIRGYAVRPNGKPVPHPLIDSTLIQAYDKSFPR